MAAKTILLVDDEPLVGESVQMILKLDEHEVECVTKPLEAWERFQTREYDLVITDNRMPAMTGMELAGRIKARNPKQPVLLLTGFPPSGPTPNIDLIMIKPFSGQDLRQAVARLTRGSEPGPE